MKDAIENIYTRLMSLRNTRKQVLMKPEDFRAHAEAEKLTSTELKDLDYLDDRVDVWIDNNPELTMES